MLDDVDVQLNANLCRIGLSLSFAAILPAAPEPSLKMFKHEVSFVMAKKQHISLPPSKRIVSGATSKEPRHSCGILKSTMQQTTLPHRVVRSAQDLASATLTGTAFELKDPRDGKYAGTSSSHASTSFEHLSSGSAQPRPGINARGSSFRNETDESRREKADQDFERFQQLDDFQSEFTACLSFLRDTFEPQEGSNDFHGALLTSPNAEPNDYVKATETITIDINESMLTHESASESISEKNLDGRSAAVRRLNQIGAHLQMNLAMQTLQQEANIQSHALMNETRSLVTDQLTRKIDDEVRSITRTNGAESSIHGVRNVVAPRHQAPVANVESAPQLSPEKEDDALQRQFHCPYYACHRNLKMHSTSSSSSSQRQCVHVGCGFATETFNSWAEHIHMPHHDLLGSV